MVRFLSPFHQCRTQAIDWCTRIQGGFPSSAKSCGNNLIHTLFGVSMVILHRVRLPIKTTHHTARDSFSYTCCFTHLLKLPSFSRPLTFYFRISLRHSTLFSVSNEALRFGFCDERSMPVFHTIHSCTTQFHKKMTLSCHHLSRLRSRNPIITVMC